MAALTKKWQTDRAARMTIPSHNNEPPNEGSSWYQLLLDTARNRYPQEMTDEQVKVKVNATMVLHGVVMEHNVKDFPGGTRILSGYTREVHDKVCRVILGVPEPDPKAMEQRDKERMARATRRTDVIAALGVVEPKYEHFELVMRWAIDDEGLNAKEVMATFDRLTVLLTMNSVALKDFYGWCKTQIDARLMRDIKEDAGMKPEADPLEEVYKAACVCAKCDQMLCICADGNPVDVAANMLANTGHEVDAKAVEEAKQLTLVEPPVECDHSMPSETGRCFKCGGDALGPEEDDVVQEFDAEQEAADWEMERAQEAHDDAVAGMPTEEQIAEHAAAENCAGAEEHEEGIECWLGCGFGAMPAIMHSGGGSGAHGDITIISTGVLENTGTISVAGGAGERRTITPSLIDGATGEVLKWFEDLDAPVKPGFQILGVDEATWFVKIVRRWQLEVEERLKLFLGNLKRETAAIDALLWRYGAQLRHVAYEEIPVYGSNAKPENRGKKRRKSWPTDYGYVHFRKTGGAKVTHEGKLREWAEGLTEQEMEYWGITWKRSIDKEKLRARVDAGAPPPPGVEVEKVDEWGNMSVGGQRTWSFAGAKRRAEEELRKLQLRNDSNDDGEEESGANEDGEL